jgi:hypothetical protein
MPTPHSPRAGGGMRASGWRCLWWLGEDCAAGARTRCSASRAKANERRSVRSGSSSPTRPTSPTSRQPMAGSAGQSGCGSKSRGVAPRQRPGGSCLADDRSAADGDLVDRRRDGRGTRGRSRDPGHGRLCLLRQAQRLRAGELQPGLRITEGARLGGNPGAEAEEALSVAALMVPRADAPAAGRNLVTPGRPARSRSSADSGPG